jgi:hypothetical protein
MNSEMITGLFTVAGAIVGGLATIAAARTERKWARAKSEILALAAQVAAYHKLEELYKIELTKLDPTRGKPKTVMEQMRGQVQDIQGFVRPTMTAAQAREVTSRWELQ